MRFKTIALAETTFAIALLCGTAQADPAAAPTLGQTLDSFHPTPQQTIALRDFLGPRGDKLVALGVSANGLAIFDLRDAKNLRTGQIAVRNDAEEGSIFVARVNGPAAFDPNRTIAPPRVQNAKMQGAIAAALADAKDGEAYEAAIAKGHDLFLRARPMLALTLDPLAGRIAESEASFFADGSGFVRILRAATGNTAATPVYLGAKFYPAIKGDGQKAFRDSVIGVDADFTATLASLGEGPVCRACPPPTPVRLSGEPHSTIWHHAVVPSAPANLIAQISPPPAASKVLNDRPTSPGQIGASGQPPGI
ncbi:MAG TPA: hypothetical protein VGG36_09220 [Rhizomicrobium sp.]|jgi:hypothetical protein